MKSGAMKFAIISDIHGNLPALNAVIEDAEKKNVDSFIFVGDYCISNPYPNECVTRIRGLDKKYVVRGNGENYLENLVGKDQSTWTDGQMQIAYWCFRRIDADNLHYLLSLPTGMTVKYNDILLHIAHSSEEFIGKCEYKKWSAAKIAMRYQDAWITPDRLKADIHSHLNHDKHFQEVFSCLENGVYIFGHSHNQWSYRSEDGKKILINPGSCGLPMDCIQNGVPYTILDLSEKENIIIEERRVAFHKEEYIDSLLHSEQYEQVNVWSKVIVKELKTARAHMYSFLRYVEEYAVGMGDMQRPFSVATWENAFELWKNTFDNSF